MDKINRLLLDAGVPPHLDGFRYLHDAAELIAEDREYLRHITKRLYPDVARRNGTNADCVERCIRNAVEDGFNRAGPELLRELFGASVDPYRGKATNSEFLAAMALRLEDG